MAGADRERWPEPTSGSRRRVRWSLSNLLSSPVFSISPILLAQLLCLLHVISVAIRIVHKHILLLDRSSAHPTDGFEQGQVGGLRQTALPSNYYESA